MSTELIKEWIAIGNRNPWIRNACDPAISEKTFKEYKTLDEMYEDMTKYSWCLGSGFYWKNICFMEQTNGAGEMLVIKDKIPFESFTTSHIKKERFIKLVEAIDKATLQECYDLNYSKEEI